MTIGTSPAGDAAQGYRIYIKPKYIAEMALKVNSECTHAGSEWRPSYGPYITYSIGFTVETLIPVFEY